MKLALGTVQFGLDYGVSNSQGKVTEDELAAILDTAYQAGIDTLDTAFLYGDAHKRLGRHQASQRFKITTKLAAPEKPDQPGLHKQLEQALTELDTDKVSGLMLHSADALLGPEADATFNTLLSFKTQGLTDTIGVSVYTPEQLQQIIQRYPIDLVQLPFSCLDQRFAQAGLLSSLKHHGVEIYARSLFLQGLLLMQDRPVYFDRFDAPLKRFDTTCDTHSATRLAAALSIATPNPEINYAVLGCVSQSQLKQLIDAHEQSTALNLDWDALASEEDALLLPYHWEV